jgi:hypothetical protein
MAEGALKSSSDWAGQTAHEAENAGGTKDLLRRLQQVEALFWCRVVVKLSVDHEDDVGGSKIRSDSLSRFRSR